VGNKLLEAFPPDYENTSVFAVFLDRDLHISDVEFCTLPALQQQSQDADVAVFFFNDFVDYISGGLVASKVFQALIEYDDLIFYSDSIPDYLLFAFVACEAP